MLWIINFFLGWVRVEIRGAYVERFLNLCSKNSISFWRMERPAPDIIIVAMTVSDFKRITPYAEKAMCSANVLSEHGIVFFAVKFKKRIILIAGMVIFLLAAWVATSFVWIIDITGCEPEDAEKLNSYLRENGLCIGAAVSDIHIGELKNDVLIKMPELSYIGVNLKGSHAYVQVRYRVVPPQVETASDEPCNIVASRSGIITSVVVTSGTREVNVGDAVTEGQLLASCYMTGRSGHTVVMRAKAQVKARTWHTETSVFPLQAEFKTYTGKEKLRYTLAFGKQRIKLYRNSRIPYEECDKIIKRTVFTLPGGVELPLALEKQILCEYVSEKKSIPAESALEYLASNIDKNFKTEEDAKILDKKYSAGFKDDLAYVTMIAECEESIGIEQKIPEGE